MEPKFIYTENVKRFIALMDLVEKRMGTDSLAMIDGRAGRGKTRTARWYATQKDCPFVESLRDWTVLWMYQSVLEAFGLSRTDIPRRKKPAFEAIVDLSREKKAPIILDEADLIGPRLLESVRDLCKVTMVPWVLIGEESLGRLMNRDRRIWSRRCATLTFSPMIARDIIAFARESCSLKLAGDAASLIAHDTEGDIRLIEIALSCAETIAQANSTPTVDMAIAKAALTQVIPEVAR